MGLVTLRESEYKGEPSRVLETETVRAEFVAHGARMVSLYDKRRDHEFLFQQRGDSYVRAWYAHPMSADQAAGYDDMFPTIAACYFEDFPWEAVHLPDHGEVWSLDWDVHADGDVVEYSVHGIRLPYRLSRRVTFIDHHTLRMDYRLENLSPFAIPYMWSAHPIFNVEEGARIVLPPECTDAYTYSSISGRIGRYGERFSWPRPGLPGHEDVDVSVVGSPGLGDAEKYFFLDPVESGWCRLEYPSNGASVQLSFPPEETPYVAVVLDHCGMDDRFYTLLEPCSAPFERLDVSRSYTDKSVLPARGVRRWYIEFTVG